MLSATLKGSIAFTAAWAAISDGDTSHLDESALLQIHAPSKVSKVKAPLANALLQTVQDISEKVNSGQDPEACSEALSALHDAVSTALPATYSQRDHHQNLVNIAASNVEQCASREENGVVMVTQQGIDLEAARAEHISCRQREDAREGEEFCEQFRVLRNTHGSSECYPLPEGDESIAWVEAAEHARDSAQTMLDEGRRLQGLCSDFRERHAATQAQCVQAQSFFEESFCAHRSSCADLEICRASAEENFISVQSEVEAAMEDVVAEFLVLKHVECLLGQANAALAAGSTVSDDSCNTPASTQELMIEYPTFSPIETCDSSVLTTPPCTSSFIEAEYSPFGQREAMEEACIACPALPLAEAPVSWIRRHGLTHIDLSNLQCAEGSPAGCTATQVHLNGEYSAGPIVRIDNGITVFRSTEQDSCPPGFKIYSPRTREDWRTIRASVNMNELRSPHHIVDVTRPQNGCGGCTGNAMNSGNAAQSSWVTSDGSPWFFRDGAYGEPNGDYEANCYLFVIEENNGEVTFNDGTCSYHSNRYLCQVRADNEVVTSSSSHTYSSSGDWTLVLQMGTEPYAMNSQAVGTLNEGASQFAKLSDAAINGLPDGGSRQASGYYYYKYTGLRPDGSNIRDQLIIRTNGEYNDMAVDLGFGAFTQCLESNRVGMRSNVDDPMQQCPMWSAPNAVGWFDTEHGTPNSCADRWFTGYGNSAMCYGVTNERRCYTSGGSCHNPRTDLKLYRYTR